MDTADESDPAVARVRRELVHLGSDEASAPDVPAAVTARIGAALRATSGTGAASAATSGTRAAHLVPRPRVPRARLVALIVGLSAALVGAVVGTSMLTRDPRPPLSHGPNAETITVAAPAGRLPLSDQEVVSLLSRAPDYGPLAAGRDSCLDGLGYPPATPVLGAAQVGMHGRPAVLLLVPGDSAHEVRAMVVEPNCNAAHTGLLAEKVVTRP